MFFFIIIIIVHIEILMTNSEQIWIFLCFGLIWQFAYVFLCLAAFAAEELDFERFHSVLQ